MALPLWSHYPRWRERFDPSDPFFVSIDTNKTAGADGITLKGALISFKPDENKIYVEWSVGVAGSKYTLSDEEARIRCSLYDTLPGFSGSDATTRNQTIYFDGQPVYDSSSVANPSTGTVLPCGNYTTGGRQFIHAHTLDVGLDYGAQRTLRTSYPYDVRTTSSRICAYDPVTLSKIPFNFTAVLIFRANGFIVRSDLREIVSEVDTPGYILTLRLERDTFTLCYALGFFILGWVLTSLAFLFACTTPLYAYPKRQHPTISHFGLNRSTPAGYFPAFNGVLINPPPERQPPRTSEALWGTVTVGGILIVIRNQYPGNPPLGIYLDFFGFCQSY